MFTAAASPTRRSPTVLACPARRSDRSPRERCAPIRNSGRKIGLSDVNSVGMKRPVAKRLGLAEFFLGQFGSMALTGSVHFQRALTDFGLPAVFAKHVLHEENYIS